MDLSSIKDDTRQAISLLFSDYQEYQRMQAVFSAGLKSLYARLETLNDEFRAAHARSPIHHIESRIKAPASIVAKLQRKGMEISLESAKKNVNDIAGIRVVCGYIDDVYRVEEMLLRQPDIVLVKRQDYIETPNYNGYRSLHLDITVPVYLSESMELVRAEVQLRTVAMDFWASLEHDLRYKADKDSLPVGINEEMLRCSDEIAVIDREMQDMYRRINYGVSDNIPDVFDPEGTELSDR